MAKKIWGLLFCHSLYGGEGIHFDGGASKSTFILYQFFAFTGACLLWLY